MNNQVSSKVDEFRSYTVSNIKSLAFNASFLLQRKPIVFWTSNLFYQPLLKLTIVKLINFFDIALLRVTKNKQGKQPLVANLALALLTKQKVRFALKEQTLFKNYVFKLRNHI